MYILFCNPNFFWYIIAFWCFWICDYVLDVGNALENEYLVLDYVLLYNTFFLLCFFFLNVGQQSNDFFQFVFLLLSNGPNGI